MDFNKWLDLARQSKFGLWKLNFALLRFVPFNKPHGFKVIQLDEYLVKVKMPYKRSNLNHIKGLHACGLATAAEYSSGLLLLSHLGMKKYRIIMESLEAKYHYQGKMPAIATFKMDEEELRKSILEPLKTQESVIKQCQVEVHDTDGNHLCTVKTNWQIKSWQKVKTK